VDHHAYLIVSAFDQEALTRELLSQLGISAGHNPDLIVHAGPLGIDEARRISARVGTRPFTDVRVLIIDASQATVQAQNALLKTLEEPGEGNKFFLVAPYEDLLLPTLRSRLQKISSMPLPAEAGVGTGAVKGTPEDFLKLTPAKRLDFAKKFKDGERVLGPFLDELLTILKKEGREADIKKVFELRRYADDTSVDSKMILEHLALVI